MIRFTSRKFLLSLSTIAALLAAKQYAEAAGVASAYVLGEAGIDVASVVKEVRKGADAAVAPPDHEF